MSFLTAYLLGSIAVLAFCVFRAFRLKSFKVSDLVGMFAASLLSWLAIIIVIVISTASWIDRKLTEKGLNKEIFK